MVMCIEYRLKNTDSSDNRELTVFTEKDGNGCLNYRSSRPALLVSSTSWTGLFILSHFFALSQNLKKV